MPRLRPFFCMLCVTLGPALLAPCPAPAAEPPAPPKGPVSFINDVAPILKENCFGCHGAKNPKGKLDMTKFASFRKGGTKDDALRAPASPTTATSSTCSRPPDNTPACRPRTPATPLPPAKIAVIEQWIKEGAKLDAGIDDKADLIRELRLRWKPPVAADRLHAARSTITALAFTPDNKKLVVSGHHELTVWDVDDRQAGEAHPHAGPAGPGDGLPARRQAGRGRRPARRGRRRAHLRHQRRHAEGGGRRRLSRRRQRQGRDGQAAARRRRRGAVPGPQRRRQETGLRRLRPHRQRLGHQRRRGQRQAGAVDREPRRLGVRRGLLGRTASTSSPAAATRRPRCGT